MYTTIFSNPEMSLAIDHSEQHEYFFVSYYANGIVFYSDHVNGNLFTIPGKFNLQEVLEGEVISYDPLELKQQFKNGSVRFSPQKFDKFINRLKKLLVFS